MKVTWATVLDYTLLWGGTIIFVFVVMFGSIFISPITWTTNPAYKVGEIWGKGWLRSKGIIC